MVNPVQKLDELRHRLNTDNEQYLFAAISYLLFLSLVVLFLKHEDPFIKHHAKQGFILFVLALLAFPFWWLAPVAKFSVGWIPNLVIAVLMVMGVLKALTGQTFRIPLISDLADKINI
jgi:uncharacterized membrane protein